jgi:hypothetical protein
MTKDTTLFTTPNAIRGQFFDLIYDLPFDIYETEDLGDGNIAVIFKGIPEREVDND